MKGEIIEQALLWSLLGRLALALVRLPGREEVHLLLWRGLGVGDEVLKGLYTEGGQVWLCFGGLLGLNFSWVWRVGVVFFINTEDSLFGGICAHLDAALRVVVLQQREELPLHQ